MTERISEIEYLKKTALQRLAYNFTFFFKSIPQKLAGFFKAVLPAFFLRIWLAIKGVGVTIGTAAKKGDWKTRVSFGVMGFSQLARGQIVRGVLFLLSEIAFIFYMVCFGWSQLSLFPSLGYQLPERGHYDEVTGAWVPQVLGHNSQLILLYSILTMLVILFFVFLWYENVKSGYAAQELQEARRRLPTASDDVKDLLDGQYHKTLLAFPLLGLLIFTVLPIIFMIFVAFTNYDKNHQPPMQLFDWVGFQNFVALFSGKVSGAANFGNAFGRILLWTIIWAVVATFSCYLLGIIVAIMINKKGIRFKKLWRTILIMTIAVPQFISLLLMSQIFDAEGIINIMLKNWGWIDKSIPFLTDGNIAKVTIIFVNMWVGVPFTMLMVTGILMNIPEDLYESARIDGAGPVKTFFTITLPYMLHVTTPYLITQFIGNLNNFNVIYLLTGGGPLMSEGASGGAGQTDLLITWLYKLIMDEKLYGLASVISIIMFIITAVISLVLYNRSNAVKNEEDFM